jgi:hypothetical protein
MKRSTRSGFSVSDRWRDRLPLTLHRGSDPPTWRPWSTPRPHAGAMRCSVHAEPGPLRKRSTGDRSTSLQTPGDAVQHRGSHVPPTGGPHQSSGCAPTSAHRVRNAGTAPPPCSAPLDTEVPRRGRRPTTAAAGHRRHRAVPDRGTSARPAPPGPDGPSRRHVVGRSGSAPVPITGNAHRRTHCTNCSDRAPDPPLPGEDWRSRWDSEVTHPRTTQPA